MITEYKDGTCMFELAKRFKLPILVNPVNCVGVMGKGLALEFKKRYPANFKNYRKLCDLNLFSVGKTSYFKEGEHFILNFVTKLHWAEPSHYSYIKLGLQDLREKIMLIKDLQDKPVILPAIGCGFGQLNPLKVKEIIYEKLQDFPCEIHFIMKGKQ